MQFDSRLLTTSKIINHPKRSVHENTAYPNGDNQTILQAGIKLCGFFATAIGALLLFVAMAAPALAADAVWMTTPGSGNWNTNGNWAPPMAPVAPGDTATFNFSTVTSLALSAPVTIDSVTFNADASAFTINTGFGAAPLTIVGAGIVNNSGATQTIRNDFGGTTNFLNNSTAANAAIINSNTGSGFGGMTNFRDNSTGANAIITNNGKDTSTSFFDTSTAGNATITNNFLGQILFQDSATAGNATITNDGELTFRNSATAGNATIINNALGTGVVFLNSATAGTSVITNSGDNSFTGFQDTSTASNATIINSGTGSETVLGNFATAGTSVITNSGDNSRTLFEDSSSAGNATLINANATAFFDISLLDATTPGMTAGSIEGNGTFFLGSKNLSVGGNQKSTTFSGVITDGGGVANFTDTGGSLTKVGSGTLTLTGINTYTGPTVVEGGRLLVDGSIASAQTSINAAGLLGGGGMIGGSVMNSGVVSPGNPVGVLTVKGNYTQTTGGTLRIEIVGLGPTERDQLVINGAANLAGTLQVIRLNDFQLRPGNQIILLAANSGVNGPFGTVQNDFATTGTIVESRIVYSSNSVVLEGRQGSFGDFATNASLTPNQVAIANALDSAVGDPRAAELIEFLNSEPLGSLSHDLDLIAPEEVAATFNLGISIANIQTSNLTRRMADVRAGSTGFSSTGFSINTTGHDLNLGLAGPTGPEGKSGPSVMQPTPQNRWGLFVTGVGEFTSVDDTNNARGYDLSTGGLTLGVDYRVGPNFAIGLTVGYANTSADLADNGNLDVNGGEIGVYATAFSGGFYVNAAATGGFNSYDTHRTALGGTASGANEGGDFTALIATGYDWKTGGLTIGPVASFEYTYVQFDSFTESGSLAPLTFDDQDAQSSRTALGVRTSYDWQVGHVLVKPEIHAAWQHEFGDRDYSLTARLSNGAGNSFTVNGPAIGRDSLLVGAGVAILFNDRISVYAYYDGELFRSNYSSQNVSAGVRVNF